MNKNQRTDGDLLFESYLRERGFDDFAYEPDFPSTTRQPDYSVPFGGTVALFEVKVFNTPSPTAPVDSFDPYPPIRLKIDAARKQFKHLKGEMCSLVLANPHHAFVLLDPIVVCGAMLGDPGLSMPFDPSSGSFDDTQTRQIFHGRGKMFRYSEGEAVAPQNTTISAVCMLGYSNVGSRLLSIKVAEEKRRVSTDRLSEDQIFQLSSEAIGTELDPANRHLRIVVCENPFAVSRLDDAFGLGPYDERYGPSEGKTVRRYVGDSLRLLEAREHEAGLEPRRLGDFG